MKRLKGVLIAAGLLSSAFLSAFARDVKVIANASIKTDSISAAELKGIFLEEKISRGDGTHVEPVNETAEDLQTYYRTLVFTGKASMPKELGSDAEVVAYVARTRGAIGYVGAETNTDGVKTLTIIRSESGGERKLLTRIEPNYPDTLKRLNIGGTVRLNVTIAPKGNVEKVEVLGGNPILGESAMRAVKQWIYSSSHSRTTLEVSIPFDSRQ
jgi:TonB family protein